MSIIELNAFAFQSGGEEPNQILQHHLLINFLGGTRKQKIIEHNCNAATEAPMNFFLTQLMNLEIVHIQLKMMVSG
ncbi:hypothetical protein LINPERHAP1_LOCUS25837 [Linum perenne]